ncbi:phosphotransferase enzyme family protein [Paenibacillus allorhizosphaerae]|uniref:Aminoglycoside phosphotransferase domain-containing protein n=1 Tax=Paenibacillus allorhizosphaerae TaxID=2849866 RepID=A0ABN7THH1_9BACL|nr:aminoglycoside phosphotransferase family protein [Paenibacillus allorhizosphaerae]CAG7626420.1 hypothetical protein PAECIP111802_01248 [Paenibacillus allorhizosphaerae]
MNHLYDLTAVLQAHYGIDPIDVTPQKGGWAALAFRVTSHERPYFLKMYEKSRVSTPKWTALIDAYMPIMGWLMHHSGLQGKIPVPVHTKNGQYKCEDDHGVYLLYEYIEGDTIGDQALSDEQVSQLSQMIAELHKYGAEITVETRAIQENYHVPYLQQLRDVLHPGNKDIPDDIGSVLHPFSAQLHERINTVEKLSAVLKDSSVRMVLCHTDIHYWNLMQSGEKLIWIDWEGLRLAPAEADLMFMVDKPYYGMFFSEYRKHHVNYEVNLEALQFYQGRRKLEDIWEFIEQLLFDDQDAQDRAETLDSLTKELKSIGA